MRNLGKKAQGMNYLAVIIALVLFGFMGILAYTVWLQFIVALTTGGFYVGQVQITADNFTRGFAAADYVIILLAVIFIIGIGLTSFRIATSTSFFIISVILGIFWGFISYFFNYIFIQMVSQDVFSVAIGVFPRTMILCTNLHWIMLLEFFVGSIALYAKKEKGQFLS